jgi:hypothetical protein
MNKNGADKKYRLKIHFALLNIFKNFICVLILYNFLTAYNQLIQQTRQTLSR